MNSPAPDATCTLSPAGAVTTVPVGVTCRVTYEFDTAATSVDLVLPYVVAIDGKVLPAYEARPGALRKGKRKIELVASPGSKIALFLNSDVHPNHRRNPVYAVQVGTNDVYVKITERKGRISHAWATLGQPVCQPTSVPNKRLEVYEAALTGDIWMQVSHLYTAAEADALLPPETSPTVRAAVCSIYAGLPRPALVVRFPASDAAPKLTLRVEFREEMQDNVRMNTTHCPWLTGILPRTHPLAYAALLTEAHAAGVTSVRVTSAWRPSFGSIAHRAGLGLDITYIENDTQHVFINRAALTNAKAPGNGNVSEREKVLWREYQDATATLAASKKERAEMQRQLDRDQDLEKVAQSRLALTHAQSHVTDSERQERLARKKWNDELNVNQPDLIRSLRDKLAYNKTVKQVF